MSAPEKWHKRFLQQTRWTESVRRFLFQQADITRADAILEAGCGSGAILADIFRQTNAHLVGIDLKLEYLRYARSGGIFFELAGADVFHLPFANQVFSHACCHFFLLWVHDPLQALLEMKRVTKPGGFILALAEPDYGGRIDHPPSLVQLGQLQVQSLIRQGADPLMGRKLKSLFNQSGLRNVQSGVIWGQWKEQPAMEEWELEWNTLESDLEGMVSQERLAELKQLDLAAWKDGERILFVPTFYTSGQI
ncbi:MAG TPA: methyltransferase domain-containing protein [Anaerolineaceae bacterium]|jgi:ubiquinone/menaquinone biosynthesis C-methylase UbiE